MQDSIVLTDLGFRDTKGIPANLKLRAKGTWNERMIIETSFSMLTVVCHTKKFFHRVADHLWSHCAYLATRFNVVTPCSSAYFPKMNASVLLPNFRSNLPAPMLVNCSN